MRVYLLALLIPLLSEGRVFKFSEEGGGTYFKFGGATSTIGQEVFSRTSGSTTVFDDVAVTHAQSAEIGMIFTTSFLNFRLGAGGLQANQVISVGSNAGGTELLTVTSDFLASQYTLGVEINVHQTDDSRMYIGLGASSATVQIKNQYAFTTTGATDLSAADHLAEMTATLMVPEICFAYEHIMVDTTTITYEFGYRQFQVSGLTHKADVSTIGGAVTAGDAVNDYNGNPLELDMSGLFVNLGFRFYLDI